MKLSVENHVLRTRFGDEKAIQMIAQAGFDALDFSFYWMSREENFLNQENYLDYAHQVRQWADRYNIAITQAHAPFDLHLADASDRQAHEYEMIRRSIECAGIMGAKQIIVHNLPTPDPADFFSVNLDFFQSFKDICRKAGTRIAIENLWDRNKGHITGGRLSTPSELTRFIDCLDPDLYCGCIDLGHAQIVGEDPADFIRQLGTPKLQALHVQDTDLKTDTHTLPYLGRHNWDEIAKSLADVHYQGDLTFEVFMYLKAFPNEALDDALRLAHTVGRNLIRRIDEAK